MRIGCTLEVRHDSLRAEVGAAHIDLVHQIKTLHRRRQRSSERNGGGIVDQNVDATESGNRLLDRGFDLRFVTNVHGDRQGAPTLTLDLFRSGENGAGQFRVGLRRFCSNDDVGAIGCGFERDRLANASA